MKKFWEKEDKVACMRIAIQCAKLLNDVDTPLFYPQKFILLTDILDNFGSLVFGRMKKLTKEYQKQKDLHEKYLSKSFAEMSTTA
jgi:hypothetical protein